MASQVGTILKSAFKKENEPINILSWVIHERYYQNLASSNCRMWLLKNGPGCKGDWKTEYAPLPSNVVVLDNYQNNPLEVIPPWVDFSLILSGHKFGIIQTAIQLGNYLGCKTCHMEHTQPTSPQLEAAVPELKKLQCDINLFISPTSRKQWGFSESEASVITHGIDYKFFKRTHRPKKLHVLTVGNDMINRAEILGFDIFQRVVINNKIPCHIVGDTKGLSAPAKNIYELKSFYDEAAIYFNPSRMSPLPMSLLEAMAMECAIVTTDNNLISEVIENGVNGYKTNNESEQLKHIQRLLVDEGERSELGKNARQTILDQFPLNRFVESWNKIFDEVTQ